VGSVCLRYVITSSGICRCLDCIERRTQIWKIVHDDFACLKRSMALASFHSRVHLISDFRLHKFNSLLLFLFTFQRTYFRLCVAKSSFIFCDEQVLSFKSYGHAVHVALFAKRLLKVQDVRSMACFRQSFFATPLHRKLQVAVTMALFQRLTPHEFQKVQKHMAVIP